MMLILENMKLALTAIRVNKMRSFLTMLGMIIGISSVIAIVSIGDTMRGVVADQYASVGLTRALVWVNYSEDFRASDYFTYEDMDKIREAMSEKIDYMDGSVYNDSTITKGRSKYKASMQGVNGGYEKVQPMEIVYGRMINESDVASKKMHIVIEDKTAMKLYGKENVVGQKFRATINGTIQDMTIVGVFHTPESILNAMMGGGTQESTYVPETILTYPDSWFGQLNIYAKQGIDMDLYQKQLTGLIGRMKNREPSQIRFYAVKDELQSMDSMLSAMSTAVGAIAGISLLVGGIGIMNIMLVSVTERTREIGIRKALGARTKDVMIQFLIESAIISAAGGLIGTALGLSVVLIGGAVLGVAVVVKLSIILIAVAFSAVVGIFFGLYPASKAAKCDPITALRYE